MRVLCYSIALLALAINLASASDSGPSTVARVVLETEYLRYEIGTDGKNAAFVDKGTGKDWCDPAAAPFFAHMRIAGHQYDSTAVSLKDGKLAVEFGDPSRRASFSVRQDPHSIILELTDISGTDVEELGFADVGFTLKGKPGESFAACALALNLQTNVHQIPGLNSAMNSSCCSRFGLVGAKVAIVGTPRPVFRDVLKEVVSAAPGLPHSSLGGPWALDSDMNRGSYLIDTEGKIGTETVSDWISLAKNLGITQIDFHTGKSMRFGDLTPNPALYPKGVEDVKSVVGRLHEAGISAGLHTYAFFIAKDTHWVTPFPDPRLAVDAAFTLAESLSADADSVPTEESTKGMSVVTGFQIRNSVTLRVDDELVSYGGFAAEPPFGFSGCKRGAWGTKATAHGKGAKITHLKESFGLFVPDGDSTLLAEVAARTAEVYNDCGFDMIYLDALDGSDILGGGLNAWYYGSKFVFELEKRLKRPALFEMSTMTHHLWYVRSRNGAWDVPPRTAKRFIDAHVISNRACDPMYLPPHLGWWGVFDWDAIQPERTFPDTIDYLGCKCIGTNCGLSLLVGFTPETYANSPNTQRLGTLIRQYEELRRSNRVAESVKARLAVPGDEFTLESSGDGKPQFRAIHYEQHKIERLAAAGETWTTHNAFGRQPLALRIEVLAGAANYDDAESTVVEEFKDAGQLGERSSAKAVSAEFLNDDALARLTATNSGASPESAWAMMGKRFSPPLDLSKRALGVWIEGDGQGEVLNFQLKTPESLGGGIQDRYVDIDFTGKRYCELVEPESERLVQYAWPHTSRQAEWETQGIKIGGIFRSIVIWADAGHVETLSVGCINLPVGKTIDCRIGPIKALPLKTVKISNPSITVAGSTLAFPAMLESGDYLECRSGEDCKIYNAKGERRKELKLEGPLPTLEAGDNSLHFSAIAAEGGPGPRFRVTAITAGEPFAASGEKKE